MFARRQDAGLLAFAVLAGLGLAAVATVAAGYLDGLAGPGCNRPVLVSCGPGAGFLDVQDGIAGRLSFAIGVLPFVLGATIGAPLIARELERRTAAVIWALVPSRTGWLVWRVAPVLALLTLVLVVLALAGDRLTSASWPLQDPARSFADFAQRGPLIVARGLATFAVAMFVGVQTRRVLPALLVTFIFCAVIGFVSDATRTFGIAAVEVEGPAACATLGCAGQVTDAYRDPLGEMHAFREVIAAAGAVGVEGGPVSDEFRSWVRAQGYEEVTIAITGAAYPPVESRESAALILITVVATAASVLSVNRSSVD